MNNELVYRGLTLAPLAVIFGVSASPLIGDDGQVTTIQPE
jgi:hypothetical protein